MKNKSPVNETQARNLIREFIGESLTRVRIFSNVCGVAFMGSLTARVPNTKNVVIENARQVNVGLMPGSGDLIGWETIVITPDMVGTRIARFVSLEVKHKARPTPEQLNWIRVVKEAGGIAGIVHTPQEVRELFDNG